MSELFQYLHRVVSTCSRPISFSGDTTSIIDRWLIKAQTADHYECNNIEPFLKPEGRLLMPQELGFLSQEEYELNWNMFYSVDWKRYLGQYSAIQKNFKLDKDKYIYALATIHCQEEQESMIFCDSMSPYSVWINGQLVFTSNYDHFIKETSFVYNFNKGINIILIEKPYFMRHESLQLNIDDLVMTVKPFSYCADQNENYFFDLHLFKDLRTKYNAIFNKSVYDIDDKIELLVIPRYFMKQQVNEELMLHIYDEKEQVIDRIPITTSTKVMLDLDTSYSRIIKVTATNKENNHVLFTKYIVIGDLAAFAETAFEVAKVRRDYNKDIIRNLRRLVSLPNIKLGTIHEQTSMMNTDLYHMIFENLYEFMQYINTTDMEEIISPCDIFRHGIPFDFKNSKGENILVSYLVLPKNYNEQKNYPLILHIESTYDVSNYPIVRGYPECENTDVIAVYICAHNVEHKDSISYDIFNMLTYLMKKFHIDRDRIYTIGLCEGTMNSYDLAMKAPGVFAAVAGISGILHVNPLDNDFEQLKNLETVNTLQISCVENADYDYSTVVDVFDHVKYGKVWLSNTYSYEDFNVSMDSKKLVHELLQYRRKRYPRRLHFTMFDPIYSQCHWIRVDKMEDITKQSIIDAEIIDDNKIDIHSSNIRLVTLLLNKADMNLSDEIYIIVDGQQFTITLYDYTSVTVHWSDKKLIVDEIELAEEQYLTQFDLIMGTNC